MIRKKTESTMINYEKYKVETETFSEFLCNVFNPFISKCIISFVIKNIELNRFIRLSKNFSNILEVNELWASGAKFLLAGGKVIDYLNNVQDSESKNDFDLFFTDEGEIVKTVKYLEANGWDHISKRHVSEFYKGSKKIQCIKKMFSSFEEILSSFDMRCCSVGIDGENIFWSTGSFKDIREKVIQFQTIPISPTQFYRIDKYKKKGFAIYSPDIMLSCIGVLSNFNNENKRYDFFLDRKPYDENKIDNDIDYSEFFTLENDYNACQEVFL